MSMPPPVALRGGRLRGRWRQLLPRFLKTPLIARRVHNIPAATAAREQGLARNNGCRSYRGNG
jgi:hypothetical protein